MRHALWPVDSFDIGIDDYIIKTQPDALLTSAVNFPFLT